jgi:hypothetical protein
MANYTAPLCDIQFVLGYLPDIYRLDQNLPRHENNFLVAIINADYQ